MMKKILVILLVFASAYIVIENSYAQSQPQSGDLVIFVQTEVRTSQGQLIAYLESDKVRVIRPIELDQLLDYETASKQDPVITMDGLQFELIKRSITTTYPSDTIVASTILSGAQENRSISLAYFDHDGFAVVKGDQITSTWTIIRPAH